mmetsp:Transcript_242/g.535  ORF Transcript_242/g.535 Transcript_242/m.535 type:complete len:219 (-) Transcript_242:158-814(-)
MARARAPRAGTALLPPPERRRRRQSRPVRLGPQSQPPRRHASDAHPHLRLPRRQLRLQRRSTSAAPHDGRAGRSRARPPQNPQGGEGLVRPPPRSGGGLLRPTRRLRGGAAQRPDPRASQGVGAVDRADRKDPGRGPRGSPAGRGGGGGGADPGRRRAGVSLRADPAQPRPGGGGTGGGDCKVLLALRGAEVRPGHRRDRSDGEGQALSEEGAPIRGI